MIVGLFGIGAFAPLAFIPVLPEAIDQVALHWKWAEGEDPETDERIIDKICSIYTFTYTLATALSPVIGSALFDAYGFVSTTEISAIFIFLMFLIYLFFYSGCNIFKQTKKENEFLYKLRLLDN